MNVMKWTKKLLEKLRKLLHVACTLWLLYGGWLLLDMAWPWLQRGLRVYKWTTCKAGNHVPHLKDILLPASSTGFESGADAAFLTLVFVVMAVVSVAAVLGTLWSLSKLAAWVFKEDK